MAGSKEIKKRIVSVKNTRKITRTMEMVSTAKAKKMTDRVNGAKPYGEKIEELMKGLTGLEREVASPYLRRVEKPARVGLLVVTADRGLCGGYNTNVLRLSRNHLEMYRKNGIEVDLHVIGKKGASYFKFLKRDVAKVYRGFDDRFSFEQAEEVTRHFMEEFSSGKIDRFEIISTVYHSSARQVPEILSILPLGLEQFQGGTKSKNSNRMEAEAGASKKTGYIANTLYEPTPAVILEKLIPLMIRMSVFRALLEAVTSEQIFRRIAMKNATDNAGEMMRLLTRYYNRVRQAAITQELSEIVAGADAIG